MINSDRYANYTFDKIIATSMLGKLVPNTSIKYGDESYREKEGILFNLYKGSGLFMDAYATEFNAPLGSLISDVYGVVRKIELGRFDLHNDDLQQLLDLWVDMFPDEPVPKTISDFRQELKPVYFAATVSTKKSYITTAEKITRHERCLIGWENPKWKGYWMIPWVRALAPFDLHNTAFIFLEDTN